MKRFRAAINRGPSPQERQARAIAEGLGWQFQCITGDDVTMISDRGEYVRLSPETIARLDTFMRAWAQQRGPVGLVDIIGGRFAP